MVKWPQNRFHKIVPCMYSEVLKSDQTNKQKMFLLISTFVGEVDIEKTLDKLDIMTSSESIRTFHNILSEKISAHSKQGSLK